MINSIIKKIKNKIDKIKRNFKKQKKAFRYLLKNYWHKDRPIETDYLEDVGIHLFYWKFFEWKKENSNVLEENLGDYLSKVVVSYFAPTKESGADALNQKTLYAVGSVLGMRCQDAVVWGSGILNTSKHRLLNIKFSDLDILAVRGPKTRKELLKLGKKCPEVYGDPVILMPRIFLPEPKEKIHKVTLIRHYSDENIRMTEDVGINTLDIITIDYENFITEICQSELIVSSSLHGIILAETYGVPAILLLPEGKNTFKYEDWYNSTGRYDIVIANSLEEALGMEPMKLPNLEKMQKDLLEKFPSFMWND